MSVNGKVAKASLELKLGDVIALRLGGKTLTVRVVSLQEFAPKAQASALYELISEEG